METYIDFNKKNSLYDFGLGIISMGNLPVANEVVEYENGYTIKTGKYESIEIPITFMQRRAKNVIDFYDDIIDWLTNVVDNRLMFSFMTDRYYIVKNVVINETIKNHNKYNTLDVIFTLEPFKYKYENSIKTTSSINLNYQGTANGEPKIQLYGNGNIQLTINNETVQINNVNGYVELDSKLLLCLNADKTSKSRDMIGNFPILIKGINNISWIGNVTELEILPRTAYK